MSGCFYAMISRMKYIERWSLMRNTITENISEHSLETAVIAHALAVIGNRRLGKHLNAEKAALIGIYHDAAEIITGDMPTPIKHFNREISNAYKNIESNAVNKLLGMLPDDLKIDYEDILFRQDEDEYLWRLVKGADKISALIKCIEEEKAGNCEFKSAYASTKEALLKLEISEVDIFMGEFMGEYYKTLDELR